MLPMNIHFVQFVLRENTNIMKEGPFVWIVLRARCDIPQKAMMAQHGME